MSCSCRSTSIVTCIILCGLLHLARAQYAFQHTLSTRNSSPVAQPYLLDLRRESVPIRRKGKVVSFKTSYSGLIHVGEPAQEFRVVFDSGSGHVVLPAVECQSEACLVHKRYNMTVSETAVPINVDGRTVLPGELCDRVSIGFGTGEVKGEFARERVCLGGRSLPGEVSSFTPCFTMNVVAALEMSSQPFRSFNFDGILGLGLDSLSLTPDFSFLSWFSKSNHGGLAQVAVFLTEGEAGEVSEMAFGGHNDKRALEPFSWTPVVLPDQGHWAVEIIAVRVDGVPLDFCRDGTCRGVVDTGTSHLAVPAAHEKELARLLTITGDDVHDCRLTDAPVVEIEVIGRNLTLFPWNYMRQMPLRADVNLAGSVVGVTLPQSSSHGVDSTQLPSVRGAASALARERRLRSKGAEAGHGLQHFCRAKLLPVRLPEPLGPKVFILGEPVLHRYYTVFDWKTKQIGFSLAANQRNVGRQSNGQL